MPVLLPHNPMGEGEKTLKRSRSKCPRGDMRNIPPGDTAALGGRPWSAGGATCRGGGGFGRLCLPAECCWLCGCGCRCEGGRGVVRTRGGGGDEAAIARLAAASSSLSPLVERAMKQRETKRRGPTAGVCPHDEYGRRVTAMFPTLRPTPPSRSPLPLIAFPVERGWTKEES